MLRRYQNNPSPFKKQSKRAYHADIITSRSLRRKRYAKNPFPTRQRSKQHYRQHRDELLKLAMHRRYTALGALSVNNKYNRIFRRKGGLSGTFTEFVAKYTRKLGYRNIAANELKAQLLVRSCLQQLSLYKHNFCTSLNRLQTTITASLNKAAEVATTDLEVFDILCGTSNTELYNCGACYNSEGDDGVLDLEKFPNCKISYIGDKCVAT